MQLEICKFKLGDRIIVTKNIPSNVIQIGSKGTVMIIQPGRPSDISTPNAICYVEYDNLMDAIECDNFKKAKYWTSPDRMRLNKVENWRQELE